MEMYKLEKLRAFAADKKSHVRLDETQLKQFELLCSLLIEANKTTNLTAITDPEEIEVKHFIDSLMAVNLIKRHSDGEHFSLIDIGCGAGFPGLPLKILFPQAEFVLVDSITKKTDFVKYAIKELHLEKIVVETDRAEFLARTQYRESFAFCTARAVADIPVLLEYCMPFLKIEGYCIFYKSGEYQDELASAANAMNVLGGEQREIEEFTLPYSTASRSLIAVKKLVETPGKYPRKAGKPSKNPL